MENGLTTNFDGGGEDGLQPGMMEGNPTFMADPLFPSGRSIHNLDVASVRQSASAHRGCRHQKQYSNGSSAGRMIGRVLDDGIGYHRPVERV